MENYVEGDLGLLFNNAVPLTLPEVSQLLRQRCGDGYDPRDRAWPLVQSSLGQVDLLQETSSSDDVVADLAAMRLRLRVDAAGGPGGFGANAHLAGLQVDEEGNAVLPEDGGLPQASGRTRRALMRRFEVVALASLTPKSVAEALVLVPSLARFEEEDLGEVITLLQQ